jgi:hypothetical protein
MLYNMNSMLQAESKTPIDINVYLASLVSDSRAVDPLLDPMRQVTASISSASELTEAQVTILNQVRHNLEDYLLTREPARFFTADSLQAQIDYHFKGNNARRAALMFFSILALTAAGTALVGWLIPTAQTQRLEVVITTCFALLHLGAALLFVLALKAFTARLRTAFVWICSGIVILGLSLVIQPLWAVFGITGGAFAPLIELFPVVLSSVAFYRGAFLLAAIFISPPNWLRPQVSGAIALAIGLLFGLLAFAINHAGIFVVAAILHASLVVVLVAAVILLRTALRRMTELYQKPIRRLNMAVGVAMLVTLETLFNRLMFSGGGPASARLITFCLVVILGGTLVLSGYLFNKASRY